MSTYLGLTTGNKLLHDLLTTGTVYLAWHTDDPTPSGDGATEVAGDGYERQRVTFGNPSGKIVANTNALTFSAMPACTITWLAVWSAQFNGTMIFAMPVTPLAVPEFQQVLVAIGDIAFGL